MALDGVGGATHERCEVVALVGSDDEVSEVDKREGGGDVDIRLLVAVEVEDDEVVDVWVEVGTDARALPAHTACLTLGADARLDALPIVVAECYWVVPEMLNLFHELVRYLLPLWGMLLVALLLVLHCNISIYILTLQYN